MAACHVSIDVAAILDFKVYKLLTGHNYCPMFPTICTDDLQAKPQDVRSRLSNALVSITWTLL